MIAIEINGTTQQFIADVYNNGVVPQLEAEDTCYLVMDDDTPNDIIKSEDLYDHPLYNPDMEHIVIHK